MSSLADAEARLNTGKGRLIKKRLSEQPSGIVKWLWAPDGRGRIPIGEVTIMAGREGLGKSTILASWAAAITTGSLPGFYRGQPRNVFYVAQEDSIRYTVKPRMMAAGADMSRVFLLEAREDEDGVVLPRDISELEVLAREDEVAAIMLDPIISLIDSKLSTDRARDVRKALEPLRKAAEKVDAAIVALAHFNKTTEGDALTKVAGSRGWVEVGRAAIGVARGDDEKVPSNELVLSQIKNNLGRLDLPNRRYRIEGKKVDTDEGETEVGVAAFQGEVDVSVDDLLAGKRGRPKKAPMAEYEVAAEIDRHYRETGQGFHLADVRRRLEAKGVSRTIAYERADRVAELVSEPDSILWNVADQ